MRYVAKIKVAGKTLHLGHFSRKSEADIVFKAAAKVRAQLDQYFVQETKTYPRASRPRDSGTA